MEKRLKVLRNDQGFTLLEILMVLLLIAILAAVGITAFVNYTKETKNASTKANLQILRNGIAAEYGKSQLDCGNTTPYWPCADMINANDITLADGQSTDTGCPVETVPWKNPQSGTTKSLCNSTQIPSVTDRQFTNPGTGIPVNPWDPTHSNLVVNCEVAGGTACTRVASCDASAWDATGGTASQKGWCYDSANGNIWANTKFNGWPTSPSTDNPEYSY